MSVLEQIRLNIIEQVSCADESTLKALGEVLHNKAGHTSETEPEMPQWQKDEVLKRIAARRANPSLLIPKEVAEARIKAMLK